MTNIAKWRSLLSGIPSPDSYINFGYYFMIAASLQRRVWCGPDHQKLFPNLYIILVGDPGVGKGLVIKPVSDILRYHKVEPMNGKAVNGVKADALEEAISDANYTKATNRKSVDKPLLIPMAPDATTYEALVTATARATRGISYRQWDEALQKHVSKPYLYCAIAFCLEEMSSLFRKKTEDTVNFIIKTYDCGDYEKDTKTQDHDVIKKSCLNFLAGTTPSFMERTFSDDILNDGFSSRVFFIYEPSNRFNTLSLPELTPEQVQYQKDIIDHIKKLTYLYGQIKFAPEAWAYLENWWKNVHPNKRANNSPKLVPYYARKNIHMQKMAIAVHCGEDAEMDEFKAPKNPISLESCIIAHDMLEEAERKMHFALSFDGANPLAVVSKKVVRFIKSSGAQTTKDLQAQFWDDVKQHEMNEILDHLSRSKKIQLNDNKQWEII